MWERREGKEGGWSERTDNKTGVGAPSSRLTRFVDLFLFFSHISFERCATVTFTCSHRHAVFSNVREEDLGRVLIHNVCQGIGVHAVKICHNMKHLSIE